VFFFTEFFFTEFFFGAGLFGRPFAVRDLGANTDEPFACASCANLLGPPCADQHPPLKPLWRLTHLLGNRGGSGATEERVCLEHGCPAGLPKL
jgi:hypothetical protein